MKIKEVSTLTGLTRKTIRFYEDTGLIAPNKHMVNGRDFRDYTQADIDTLTDIAVLRKARFTIDEIRSMQEGLLPVKAIFSDYYLRMKTEQQELEKLLRILDAISAKELETKSQLVQEISGITENMALPLVDVHPHFKYIDALEEKLNLRHRKKQHADFTQTAALHQSYSLMQSHTKPGVRDGSMPGNAVLLTMRMLDRDKEHHR